MSTQALHPSYTAHTGMGGVCLNMIVKDEQDVIERCLASVLPCIDSWCIVDTGSTDHTIEIINRVLRNVPGQVYSLPWTNHFADMRNKALELAFRFHDPSHLMFIDADEELLGVADMRNIKADPSINACLIRVQHENRLGNRFWMIQAGYPGRWTGARHEDMEPHGKLALAVPGIILSHLDSARGKNRAEAVRGDLESLLWELKNTDPHDPRTWYYLGATYLVAKDYVQANRAFETRLTMEGNPEEKAKAQAFVDDFKKASAAMAQEVAS